MTRDTQHGIARRHLMVKALAAALTLVGPVLTPAAQRQTGETTQAVITVRGMQCPFCAYGIKKHLGKLPGVRKVEVELAKNRAVVTFDAGATTGDNGIQEAVRKAGFTAGTIEWRSGEGGEARRPTP